MILVKATAEGLLHHRTASGYLVDAIVPFVALPSVKALHRALRVTNPLNGRSAVAIALDVGPWNLHDDAYVFGGARPQAETGIDMTGRPTNGAGIDLGVWIWRHLAMRDNTDVQWEWVT